MYIGLDIGGSNISAGIFDEHKNLLKTAKVKSKGKSDSDTILGQIFKVINKLLDDSTRDKIKAIGIGIAGFVDSKNGILNFSANINLNGINIAKEVSQKFGNVPVFIENDVNVGVIGEWKYGVGQGHENIVGIFAGTGIGGGLVINNQFLYGVTGGAGAVGHVSINTQGTYCQSCGSQGCVETYAGKVGMENRILNLHKKGVKSLLIDLVLENNNKLKGSHLKKALDAKDSVAEDIVNLAMTNLGIAIANYINLLNPSLVLLGGGVMEAIGHKYLNTIYNSCSKYAFKTMLEACELKIATLGDNSGVYGAMDIAVNRLEGNW
ncbi:ROK family protein [Francisella philomiragia]|uniref:ROK family protein n=1 Tax=Francisella philomiragia subsp. philomiragia (strain ATCC 25017 / CCUG 19701 / FSC 153 / O\|nr:ROK family protein [Francisella philomiragia]AJI46556.1 ROK family protein [Francisella philomiragia]AJI49659.1 ROK family protein [Francisella philomiragia]MBK2020079.1 ROK family protein [Francisella philomiragia]MBK2029541.1 ROK family protein [Francisella philomiragia]MBK2263337.1 ROK family protein [Francisella philomiragia]